MESAFSKTLGMRMLDEIETINYGSLNTPASGTPPLHDPAEVDQLNKPIAHPPGDRPAPVTVDEGDVPVSTASVPAPEVGRRDPRKAALSGWIGSALEYYDFALYSTSAALVFPTVSSRRVTRHSSHRLARHLRRRGISPDPSARSFLACVR